MACLLRSVPCFVCVVVLILHYLFLCAHATQTQFNPACMMIVIPISLTYFVDNHWFFLLQIWYVKI